MQMRFSVLLKCLFRRVLPEMVATQRLILAVNKHLRRLTPADIEHRRQHGFRLQYISVRGPRAVLPSHGGDRLRAIRGGR